MKRFDEKVRVGLREKDTEKLVAAYPEPVDGNMDEIRDKVFFWFYQQSCSAEDALKHYYVDVLTDREIKMAGHQQ